MPPLAALQPTALIASAEQSSSKIALLGSSTLTHQQLAGAQDEACICVANAAGKLAKCARIAGVGVSAKQYFACRRRQDGGLPAVLDIAEASSQHARCMQAQPVLDTQDLARAAADAAEAATSSSCSDDRKTALFRHSTLPQMI